MHIGVISALLSLEMRELIIVDASTLKIERTLDFFEPTWNEPPRQYASFTAPGKSRRKKGKR